MINSEGMCSLWNGDMYAWPGYWNDDPGLHVIIDKEGNILYENSGEGSDAVIYASVTPSGNILRKTFKSDFEHGEYQVLEFVQPDGTSKQMLEGGFIYINGKGEGCTDYFEYSCGYEDDSASVTEGVIDRYCCHLRRK